MTYLSLLLIDSLALLEKKNDEYFSQSIDAVAKFYLSKIAGNQEKLDALRSHLSKGQYTDRCKNAIEVPWRILVNVNTPYGP